jgi:hypothetical protein
MKGGLVNEESGVDGRPTKQCPYCAEQIQAEALVCHFCGYDYATQSRPNTARKTNGLAVASLVLGIVWIYWIGSVLAVVFGHVALHQIKESNNAQSGRGMAIAGLVLGYIGLGIVALLIVVAIIASASGG